MSQELTSDVRLESCARRIEAGARTTIEGIMIAGEALAEAKELCGNDNNKFGAWRESRLPWLKPGTALNFRRVWDRFHNNCGTILEHVAPTALYMLAAPETPLDVITQVEAKAAAGEDVSVSEIARLKAEHKAQLDAKTKEATDSKAAADRAARDLAALEAKSKEKADAASRREANLISERNETKQRLEEARADKARAIADKDEAKRVAAEQAEKAAEDAWQEADEKYETIVNRLTREAKEAKEAAEKAGTEAEETAKALAEAKINEMMAQKQGELKRLQADSDRAASRATAAYEAEQRAKKSLEDYQKAKVVLVSNDREIAQMVAFNASVLEFIGEKMAELSQFETDAPSDTYAKFSKSAQFCEQFASALRAFIAPRIA